MTPEDREEIKQSIKDRIQEIEASLKSLEDTSKPVEPDVSLGRLTRMDAIQIQKMQEANLEVARANIAKLTESLKHIDNENFVPMPLLQGYDRHRTAEGVAGIQHVH